MTCAQWTMPGGEGRAAGIRNCFCEGGLPLRNLKDSEGNQYLCNTPLQGMESSVPWQEACSLLDGWLADQY